MAATMYVPPNSTKELTVAKLLARAAYDRPAGKPLDWRDAEAMRAAIDTAVLALVGMQASELSRRTW